MEMEMEMEMEIVSAVNLLLKPLSDQIKDAGGKGYNCDVLTRRVQGSFSVEYHFETSEGKKCLKTLNIFDVGMIDDGENRFVQFDNDANEYTLVTPRDVAKPTPRKMLFIKPLGSSFDEMKRNLKDLWPNRVVWNLTAPDLNI